jgi:hypothetical protein
MALRAEERWPERGRQARDALGRSVSAAVSRTSLYGLAMAVHGNVKRCADFTHAIVAEPSQTLDKDCKRHALDRVEVDRGPARHWIATLLQYDLAG